MASQLRSRRKRTFNRDTSSNEVGNVIFKPTSDSPSTAIMKTPKTIVKQEETSLNVRRSSRKPKPKRHNDDEELLPEFTATIATPIDAEQHIALVNPAEQSTSTGVKVRRETRKTFQNYLETLGYNADFSKKPFKSEHQHYLENEHIDTIQKTKPAKESDTKITIKQEPSDDVEDSKRQVRVSSRTPKPKKKFSFLDDSEAMEESMPQPSTSQTPRKRIEDVVAKILKQKTVTAEKQKSKKIEPKVKKKEVSRGKKVSSNNKDDECINTFSPSDDSGQARVSKRARVPKRRFSLIENDDDVEIDDTKQQQMMSSESGKPTKGDIDDNAVTAQSKLVIKRSDSKRKRIQARDNQPNVIVKEDVTPKMGRNSKRARSNETRDQLSIEKTEEIEGKGKQDGKKGRSKNIKKEPNGTEDENPAEEHIVLKLSIPHDSSKQNEKDVKHIHKHHHHHHHHHKHKKEKRHNTEGQEKSSESQDLSDKDSVVKGKQKKKKFKQAKPHKIVTSESSTSDGTHGPHVKLVIKKSPLKSKGVKMVSEVLTSAMPGEVNVPDPEKIPKKKSKVKLSKEVTKGREKPSVKNQKKKVGKKEIKARTVSAYSLFTKSKRRALAKMEPELDFAGISRRLAEMWKDLSVEDRESWRQKAISVRSPYKSITSSRPRSATTCSRKKETEVVPTNSPADVLDMAAYLKLLGESLCSIGICLKRQDQMEVHGSLSVLLDTALCSVVPLFCLTSQLPEMAGCSSNVQAQILDNIAYIIPGL